MNLQLYALNGCAPAPLANYLKALGILRLIVEQGADPSARGWWQDEHFHLLTKLSQRELELFFLNQYEPTPLLSPWIKSSNLLKPGDKLLSQIELSSAKRFECFQTGIEQAKLLLGKQREADEVIRAIKARTKTNKAYQTDAQRELLSASGTFKDCLSELRAQTARTDLIESRRAEIAAAIAQVEGMVIPADRPPDSQEAEQLKKGKGYNQLLAAANRRFRELKDETLIPDCRKSWRGGLAAWVAAAVVLDADGKPAWPSMFGASGGNDGHFDFPNNFMQRLGELFDVRSEFGSASHAAEDLLGNALWDIPTSGLTNTAMGQFQPGAAGGANSSTGAMGDKHMNPWDFVLMMEGSVLFSAGVSQRLDSNSTSRAAAPFAVYSHAAGYGSSGAEKAQRGEQWLPLWGRPATLSEVAALFGEARVQLGRQTANRPVDVARAISRLGVARGIYSFTRYGYLERNGQSTLAVPLGRMDVREVARSRLIDDLAPWMDRLRRLARSKHAPGRLIQAERRLADTVIAALTHDETPERWQAILLAAADVERLQATSCGFSAGPIPPLSPEWIASAGNGIEVRLAAALGSAAGEYTKMRRPRDPVRYHLLPLEPGARRFRVSEERLAKDSRVVMMGRDVVADCAAIVQRRMIEADMKGQRRLPLVAAPGFGAQLSDLSAWLAGVVDLDRVLSLARAFMAVRWSVSTGIWHENSPNRTEMPPEGWLALRLACLPWPLLPDRNIPAEPGIVRRLLAGDSAGAMSLALARLRSAGIRPPLRSGVTDKYSARLWAAALVFPIDRGTALRAATVLDPTLKGSRHA